MIDVNTINFNKQAGLIPVCVQDYTSMQVLMMAFMNKEALEQSLLTKKVTFWSRTKQRLWTKGETSGNYLLVVDVLMDCDNDALLIYVTPVGPTCHTGKDSCFNLDQASSLNCLEKLIKLIENRHEYPQENSYTTNLFNEGTKRIAQKVGEEGLEVAIAAVAGDDEELANESADLLYHLFVLLKQKELKFSAVTNILQDRMQK
jgi:phosphoribosyl-ATP pyrophosphohydrolase/phosphoribosyl-AMP cyclohydrolase